MNSFRRTIFLLASLFLCLVSASHLRAQSAQASIDPARLPKNTVFYVLWRGAPSPAARSANSLYSLWDDPGFAPARNALFDSFMSESRKSGDPKSQITHEEISEFTTLFENPMAFGFVSDPTKNNSASVSQKANGDAHKWNGFFFIYDRTGKEALLAKAILRFRASEKFPPKLTPTTIAGVPAMKVEHKSETEYWVETGKYVITSGETSVVEQILRGTRSGPANAPLLSQSDVAALEKIVRDNKIGAPASAFLGGVPAFKEASPVLGSGVLEFFLNLGDAIKLAGNEPSFSPQGIRPSAILDSIKMSSVHSISGHVFLDGAKTRFQAGILGDATSGSIFDIWDAGQAKPASIAYITPNAVSYRETQLNLSGIYALAMRIAKPFLPKSPDDKTDMIEMAAQMKLGMSTTDALNSLTGELGYLQSDSSFDFGKNTFFVGVRNRENALKLIRRALIDEISADTDENGVTYLTLDFSKPAEGQKSSVGNRFYLAVAKDMILVAGRRESLRAPLAQSASSATPNQLASFFANHNGGPAAVNGLSFTDFQKFDWQSLKHLPGRNKAAGASVLLGMMPDKTAPAPQKSWLEEIDPKVFSSHLHLSLGYTWKDANGLHMDGWID